MLNLLRIVLSAALSSLKSRRELAVESLALRQQLAVLGRRTKRPKLTWVDRAFWVTLSRRCADWRRALMLVKPATVIAWHRKGFALYWTRKSRKAGGRPRVDTEARALLRRMSTDNIVWGAPRNHGELLKLGFFVSEATVSRYMPRRRAKPPSQTWRTFLRNHMHCAVGIDFFVVPTATLRLLYVFVVLDHARRRIVHVNVTDQPSARWTVQQLIEAFPYDIAPRYLLRDRDSIYGSCFSARVQGMGIEQVISAPRAPWQNPYAERVIGSIRRECTDHLIITGERHLRHILRPCVHYNNADRTHDSLSKDAPDSRAVCSRGKTGPSLRYRASEAFIIVTKDGLHEVLTADSHNHAIRLAPYPVRLKLRAAAGTSRAGPAV